MSEVSDLKLELWLRLQNQTAGMMGIEGGNMHMRPMSPLFRKDSKSVWFLCAPDNKLAQDNAKVYFTVQSPDERFYACVTGTLAVSQDQEKLEEMWSVFASAFFEGGPKESNAILLELEPGEAEIWTVEAGGTQFAAEIVAHSAFGDTAKPNVGNHEVVSLP